MLAVHETPQKVSFVAVSLVQCPVEGTGRKALHFNTLCLCVCVCVCVCLCVCARARACVRARVSEVNA